MQTHIQTKMILHCTEQRSIHSYTQKTRTNTHINTQQTHIQICIHTQMIQHCTEQRTISALIHANSNKNPLIRGKVALFVCAIIESMGGRLCNTREQVRARESDRESHRAREYYTSDLDMRYDALYLYLTRYHAFYFTWHSLSRKGLPPPSGGQPLFAMPTSSWYLTRCHVTA